MIIEIKKYKSIIKEKKKKHDKKTMLRKYNFSAIEVIILRLNRFICYKIYEVYEILWDEKRNKKSWNFYGIHYIKAMETYCVSCKKYTATENSNVRKTKQNRLVLLSNFAIFNKKKSTNSCERIKKYRETGNLKHLCGNKLKKPRTISDEILKEKTYEIRRNRNYVGYQRALGLY